MKTHPNNSNQFSSPGRSVSADTNPDSSLSQAKLLPPMNDTCTRAMILAKGLQVDASRLAQTVGIQIPVFLTRRLYARFQTASHGVTLPDILRELRDAIRRRGDPSPDWLPFTLYVRDTTAELSSFTRVIAEWRALDLHDCRPAITIMLTEEE